MNESSDRRKKQAHMYMCVCVCVNRESSSRKMRALSNAMQGALYLIIRLKDTIEFISIRGRDIYYFISNQLWDIIAWLVSDLKIPFS